MLWGKQDIRSRCVLVTTRLAYSKLGEVLGYTPFPVGDSIICLPRDTWLLLSQKKVLPSQLKAIYISWLPGYREILDTRIFSQYRIPGWKMPYRPTLVCTKSIFYELLIILYNRDSKVWDGSMILVNIKPKMSLDQTKMSFQVSTDFYSTEFANACLTNPKCTKLLEHSLLHSFEVGCWDILYSETNSHRK